MSTVLASTSKAIPPRSPKAMPDCRQRDIISVLPHSCAIAPSAHMTPEGFKGVQELHDWRRRNLQEDVVETTENHLLDCTVVDMSRR